MNINLTLLGQTISIAIFVWFVMKYVWPPLINAMDQRRLGIESDLRKAAKSREEIEQNKHEAEKIVSMARQKADSILKTAEVRATGIVTAAEVDAKTAAVQEEEKSRVRMAGELQAARESLHKEVGALVVEATQKLLEAEIDQTKHDAFLQNVISKVKVES